MNYQTTKIKGKIITTAMIYCLLSPIGFVSADDNSSQNTTKQQDEKFIASSQKKVQETIIIDGHVDAPYQIINHGSDISKLSDNNFDYEKAVKGGFNAPFFSIYVAAKFQETGGAKSRADSIIGLVDGLIDQHPDKFQMAKNSKDIVDITKSSKIALTLGMENGAPIEGDIKNLVHFYERGIRYITLTHSKVNHISDSSYDENKQWGGLSPFGKLLVKYMNAIGMIIDVSHISDEAFYDVIELTQSPVIASHSSLRHFTPGFERNMSDEMLVKLAENGGMIMINFGSSFLTKTANDLRNKKEPAYKEFLKKNKKDDNEQSQKDFEIEWMKKYPFATIDDVVDHIDRVVKLVGVDHVGIGSDFDGVGDSLPVGLKDVSMMSNLVSELYERGYSDADITKILSGNFLKVWKNIEKNSKSMMKSKKWQEKFSKYK